MGCGLLWVCEVKCAGCEVGFKLVAVGVLAEVDALGKNVRGAKF